MKEITPRQPAGTLAANLDQLIESFLLAQDVGITSKVVYRRALKRFKEFLSLREAAGGVGYLTKTDIVQYKSHLLAEGLSPRTGNLYLTSVRQFFKYLESNRIYPMCPRASKVSSVRTGSTAIRLPFSRRAICLRRLTRQASSGCETSP